MMLKWCIRDVIEDGLCRLSGCQTACKQTPYVPFFGTQSMPRVKALIVLLLTLSIQVSVLKIRLTVKRYLVT